MKKIIYFSISLILITNMACNKKNEKSNLLTLGFIQATVNGTSFISDSIGSDSFIYHHRLSRC